MIQPPERGKKKKKVSEPLRGKENHHTKRYKPNGDTQKG